MKTKLLLIVLLGFVSKWSVAQSDTFTIKSFYVLDTLFVEFNDVRDLDTELMYRLVPATPYNLTWCMKPCLVEPPRRVKYLRIGYSPKFQDSTHKMQLGVVMLTKENGFRLQALAQSNFTDEVDLSFGFKTTRYSFPYKGVMRIPLLRLGVDAGFAYRNGGSIYAFPHLNIVIPNGRWNIEIGGNGYSHTNLQTEAIWSFSFYGLFRK